MVALRATDSSTLSLQQSLLQSRVAQAKRDAEQAETQAQSLRQQADRAEKDAQASRSTYQQTREQALRGEAATYSVPGRSGTSAVPTKTQDFLVRMYNATADKFAAAGNPLKSASSPASSKNALGQTTGRIVNITA
jgi:hypothetical protein